MVDSERAAAQVVVVTVGGGGAVGGQRSYAKILGLNVQTDFLTSGVQQRFYRVRVLLTPAQ